MDSNLNKIFLDEDALAYDTSDDSDHDPGPNRPIGDDSSSDEGITSYPPNQTPNYRPQGDIANKICHVLHAMGEIGLTLTQFLDAVSWGDPGCISNPMIRNARTSLMGSKELPSILRRWWRPPRVQGSSHPRAAGASQVMEEFAHECITRRANKEMEEMVHIFETGGDDVSEESLTNTVLSNAIDHIKSRGPLVWSVLSDLAHIHDRGTSHKKLDTIILIIISMLSYTRSSRRGRFQKLFSIYFKFRGLTAKGFDVLHALGLTMSHKWTCNAVGRMSLSCMKEMRALMEQFSWQLTYDNLNIPFRVFSQRLDNQGEFGSATAATVYIKRSAAPLSPAANRNLQETRAEGLKKPLSAMDIILLAYTAYPQIDQQVRYEVLQILFNAADFDIQTYKYKDDSLLQRPAPVRQLPSGKEHITLQFLLGTVNIPEASYEDNSRLIKEWLHQLQLDTPAMQEKLGLETVIAWVGDQLTIDRLRNLFKFRAEDLNSFDRLDWMILTFGWFHLLMAVANSLHKQYLGTSRGRGLNHAFDVLEKKGLGSVQTKGPFFHDLNETLYTVAEAHIREDWLLVGDAKTLAELRMKTPEDLLYIASKIVSDHASSDALERMEARPEKQRDEMKHRTIMWNRDILQYIVLDRAIKHGDVGLMEACLPQLLLRFVGGKNSNYAIEVLELLQSLEREWPSEIKDFVRDHCWLANMSGKRDGFLPFDLAQEHNNRDIKVNYRSQGPSIDWEYLNKLHPAIHIINAVGVHVEQAFETLSRGKKHAVPKREQDIQVLQQAYREARLHHNEPGRKFESKRDRVKDMSTIGAIAISQSKTLARWAEGRSFPRSSEQEWNILSDSEDED